MKKQTILTLMLFFFMGAAAQNSQNITLKGQCLNSLSPSKSPQVLYLIKRAQPVDSAVVKDGKFEFALKNIQPDEYVLMRINEEGKKECVLLYLDYCDTYITLTPDIYTAFGTTFIKCFITGNPTDAAVREVNDMILTSYDEKIFTSQELISKLSSVADRHDMASAYVIGKYYQLFVRNGLIPKVEECVKQLSETVLNSPAGINMKKSLVGDDAKKLDVSKIGYAPDFTLNTPDGKPVTLSEFIKGKKLVLIDFWASWCAPCRKEGENVKAIYAEYKSKGFDVISVSLDEDATKWREAIKKDGLTWVQVSDLKGWKTHLSKLYNFSGVPALYLVDGKGKIIAINLRGQELRNKVAEICK